MDISKYPFILANYPHLIKKLELHWGYPEMYTFLETVFFQDRDKARDGFPHIALLELNQLRDDHLLIVPEPQNLNRILYDLY